MGASVIARKWVPAGITMTTEVKNDRLTLCGEDIYDVVPNITAFAEAMDQ